MMNSNIKISIPENEIQSQDLPIVVEMTESTCIQEENEDEEGAPQEYAELLQVIKIKFPLFCIYLTLNVSLKFMRFLFYR